jgi:hypothetical protein
MSWSEEDRKRLLTAWQFVAGGLTGVTTKTITAPLERVKILQQVQASSAVM